MLPKFLCIGAQKAGTSWLYANLNQHPSIWMPPLKELHYFDHLFVPENRRWTIGHLRKGAADAIRWHANKYQSVDFAYMKYLSEIVTDDPFSETWYRRLFDRPGAKSKLLGDITPEYSTIPDQGIGYVRQLLGGVRIVYIIRDPVGRALSQLRMNLERTGYTPQTEKDWLQAALSSEIINRGDYLTYIPRWLHHFAEEDIMFIPYRQIGQSPRALLDRIESFLGIERYEEYSLLESVVHETRKIEIPAAVTTALKAALAPQREFLEKYFGAEFLAGI